MDAELETLAKPGKGLAAPDGSGEESSDPEFGHLNQRAKNKGNKTSVSASAGVKRVIEIAAAASGRIKTLKAGQDKLRKTIRQERRERKALETNVEEMQAQIDEFTENELGPRALPSDVRMLLEKSGHNVSEVMASGRKFAVAEVDEMLAATGLVLSPVERATMKNHLLSKGLMEQGEVNRTRLN